MSRPIWCANLSPLAAAEAWTCGAYGLALQAEMRGDTTTRPRKGTDRITGGMSPVPALIGDAATSIWPHRCMARTSLFRGWW